MTIWSGEIKELDKLYGTFKGHLPEIVKEMEQLIKTDDPNVVLLYSRRCLEVIVTDLCETELKRPRKTEPLKGIIDKLASEEKVPSNIIASMQSLNTMSTFGTHPKDFDPEQVKPVLNNLAIIIRWYLKYKDFQIVSKTDLLEQKLEGRAQELTPPVSVNRGSSKYRRSLNIFLTGIFLITSVVVVFKITVSKRNWADAQKYMSIDAYRTIKIDDQVWMAENLKTTLFNDGTAIPLVKDDKEWENTMSPAYCFYENNRSKYIETYGVLYNWFAVKTGKLCPVGWHVPTDDEWTKLDDFLGDSIPWIESGDSIILVPEKAAIKLKEAGNLHWALNDTINATDDYGFTALPGGARLKHGPFFDLGYQGFWWSSTEDDTEDAKNREMYWDQNGVTDIQQYKQFGMSVRCIKDR